MCLKCLNSEAMTPMRLLLLAVLHQVEKAFGPGHPLISISIVPNPKGIEWSNGVPDMLVPWNKALVYQLLQVRFATTLDNSVGAMHVVREGLVALSTHDTILGTDENHRFYKSPMRALFKHHDNVLIVEVLSVPCNIGG
jgi:hypothetical protein